MKFPVDNALLSIGAEGLRRYGHNVQTGATMASTLPLDKMSVEEKLQAMESLWDDLCNKAGGVSSPAWHGEVLAERDAMQKRGDDQFEDWEAAKRNIRNKVS